MKIKNSSALTALILALIFALPGLVGGIYIGFVIVLFFILWPVLAIMAKARSKRKEVKRESKAKLRDENDKIQLNDTPGVAGSFNVLPREIKELAKQYIESEAEVCLCIIGDFKQTLIALQNKLVIIKPGLMAGAIFGAKTATFLYKDITGIEINTGPLTGVIEISTPSYESTKQKGWWSFEQDRSPHMVSNCLPISKNYLEIYKPYLTKLSSMIEKSKHLEPRYRENNSIASELEKLNELRSSGVLSDEEFKQAKKRLLDS